MHQHSAQSDPSGKPASFWKSGGGVAIIMLALIVAFYLIREHWTHLGHSWPYLLLLLCPAMHLFMHGGHGGRGGHDHTGTSRDPGNPDRDRDTSGA